jgi:hypothetical protein
VVELGLAIGADDAEPGTGEFDFHSDQARVRFDTAPLSDAVRTLAWR